MLSQRRQLNTLRRYNEAIGIVLGLAQIQLVVSKLFAWVVLLAYGLIANSLSFESSLECKSQLGNDPN